MMKFSLSEGYVASLPILNQPLFLFLLYIVIRDSAEV